MSEGINIRHAFIISVGLSRNCWDTVNEIYAKDEEKYYERYINSGFVNDAIKNLFTIRVEEIINKTIGIVEDCYAINNFIKLERIIRQIHPSILNFVKKSNSTVELEKFKDRYLASPFTGEILDELSESDVFAIIVSVIYASQLYGKDVGGTVTVKLFQDYWNGFTRKAYLSYNRYKTTHFGEDWTKEIEEAYKVLDLDPKKEVKEDKLELFVDAYIEKYVRKKCEEEGFTISKDGNLPYNSYKDIRSNIFTLKPTNYIGAFSRLMDTLGIDCMDAFNDTPMNKDILNMVFKDLALSKLGNNITDEESALYAISAIFIYNLAFLYNDAKELYLKKSKEEKYRDLRALEEKVNKEKEELDKKIEKSKDVVNIKDYKLKQLEAELKLLRKENVKLTADNTKLVTETKKQLMEIEELNKDKAILLEVINSIESNDEGEEEVSLEEMIEYINKYKVGIFGGKKNIKNLGEAIDNVNFYENMTQDISSIKNLDMVFINSSFFNHAFTNKVIANKEKFKIPFGYISGTNINKIIKTIYMNLKKEYK